MIDDPAPTETQLKERAISVEQLQNSLGQQEVLKQADVIFGWNRQSDEMHLLFGRDLLQRVADQADGSPKDRLVVAFSHDGSDFQQHYLRAQVQWHKGSVEAPDPSDQPDDA